MKLNAHEYGTPLWTKLSDHYTEKLCKYRSRIEVPSITEAERIQLAWKIWSVKELLALAEPEREQETVAD